MSKDRNPFGQSRDGAFNRGAYAVAKQIYDAGELTRAAGAKLVQTSHNGQREAGRKLMEYGDYMRETALNAWRDATGQSTLLISHAPERDKPTDAVERIAAIVAPDQTTTDSGDSFL